MVVDEAAAGGVETLCLQHVSIGCPQQPVRNCQPRLTLLYGIAVTDAS
jgi:hypothetical protein